MSCSLFVAEVRGSRRCSVCRCDMSAHQPAAIYVQPERIFTNLSPSISSALISNFIRMSNSRVNNNNNNDDDENENDNNNPPPPPPPLPPPLSHSQSSAFSPYSRLPLLNKKPASIQPLPPAPKPQSQVILRPEPRFGVSKGSSFLRQEGSDSNISKKIRSKRRERPRSVGLLDLGCLQNSDCAHADDESRLNIGQRSSLLIPQERSNDFKQILQRFQIADTNSPIHHYSYRLMSPPVAAWQTNSMKLDGSQESWSTPPHRNSLNSNYRDSPVGSRNHSARSRLSISSMHSPHCFLPTTRDSSPRSIPSPSMVPMRPGSSPDVTINELHHSPLSHTGSTPEPTGVEVMSKTRSYTIGFSPHDVYSPTTRWVKETDVDDPLSLPTMSPIDSSDLSDRSNEGVPKPGPRSAPMSKMPSVERVNNDSVALRNNSVRGYNNRSCRRAVLERGPNASPNGIYVRRSRSKDDRSILNYLPFGVDNQVSRTSSIPVFASHESLTQNLIQSPFHSPVQSQIKSTNRDRERQSSHNLANEDLYKHFQQISLSHVQTLNIVADKLSEQARRGEEPVSRNRLAQLDFTSFVIPTSHPILTKGKSLFYNALLPRQGLHDYPVTLMIAPCSQYAPLMRKTESNHFGLPGFLEIEDHDGAIRQFLFETGTQNLDGRNTKVIVMPRLNLCSFHSLAAHQLDQRLDRTNHEELVSFILLQLLLALKMLQGEGVESLSTNFKEFLLSYRFKNINSSAYNEFPRLLFLPDTLGAEIETGGDELVGLCRYALRALCTLLHHKMDGKAPPIKLRSRFSRALAACSILLQEDKSNSLTKAKNVLELSLWSDGQHFRTEQEARTWIDTARAECVDNLVRQLINEPMTNLGVRERFRIEFLLAATPRSIMDSQKATMTAIVK